MVAMTRVVSVVSVVSVIALTCVAGVAAVVIHVIGVSTMTDVAIMPRVNVVILMLMLCTHTDTIYPLGV